MGTRQREVHGIDVDSGGQFGLVDRFLDRIDSGLEVHDHAAPDSFRIGEADADDVQAALVGGFSDDRGDLGRSDIQADYVTFLARHWFPLQLVPGRRAGRCPDDPAALT